MLNISYLPGKIKSQTGKQIQMLFKNRFLKYAYKLNNFYLTLFFFLLKLYFSFHCLLYKILLIYILQMIKRVTNNNKKKKIQKCSILLCCAFGVSPTCLSSDLMFVCLFLLNKFRASTQIRNAGFETNKIHDSPS